MPVSFEGSAALDCQYADPKQGGEWEQCYIDKDHWALLCQDVVDGECSTECEPSTMIRELLPGQSVELDWQSITYVPHTEPCNYGQCWTRESVPSGMYRFSLDAYPGINTETAPTEDGIYYDETLEGKPVTYAVDFEIPCDEDHLTIVIAK